MVIVGLALLFVPTYVDRLSRLLAPGARRAGARSCSPSSSGWYGGSAPRCAWSPDAPAAPGAATVARGPASLRTGAFPVYLPAGSARTDSDPARRGLALARQGRGLRRLWFPIALIVFLAPIPGSLMDQVLLPLKGWVSATVDTTLHVFGYPIARDGVVLTIGPYSLLIADACSGLNSMVALSGIGLLYVYLAGHTSRAHNVVLLLSVLPIAFLANIIRVILLVLITYYGGESSGQAFHDHAGVLEVALAFGRLLRIRSPAHVDHPRAACAGFADRREPVRHESAATGAHGRRRWCWHRSAAWYLTPRTPARAGDGAALAQLVPRSFGEWRELDAPAAAVDPRGQRPGETDSEAPYDDVLMRSYINARGDVVMLALAYGRHQRQEIKIHRPELCYTSQGFAVLRKSDCQPSPCPRSRRWMARACW